MIDTAYDLAASTALPEYSPPLQDADLDAIGIIRGAPLDGEPYLVHAAIPDGWSRVAVSEKDMHILDERGVPRAEAHFKGGHRGILRVRSNPGACLAGDLVRGNGPMELPNCWARMTSSEKKNFAEWIDDQIADPEAGDRRTAERAIAAQALLRAAGPTQTA